MRDLIARAIGDRLVLTVNYPPGIRTIEPHALGVSSTGNLLLRAYQTAGASSSGEHEWWKLLRLDRLISVNLQGLSFDGPRPEYKQGDKAMVGGIIRQL
jgi:hypothetical protein